MAEKEGFEPSIPFWGIHDFQSCALDQTTRLLHAVGRTSYEIQLCHYKGERRESQDVILANRRESAGEIILYKSGALLYNGAIHI